MNIVEKLVSKGLASPPRWLPNNTMYLTMMGSVAYGVSSDTSDVDVYGFAIPPKDVIFPHLKGHIPGFGRQKHGFDQYQQHHINDVAAGKEYDLSVYNIVKYFSLCMENNPNMIDSLFTPEDAVLHNTKIAQMVRERRKIFLHKGCWHKFKGYAFSQVHKMKSKNRTGKRAETVEKYGFDVKFAYHVIRLMGEVQMILEEGDLDLRRDRERMKAVRRGEWSLERVESFFATKEKVLEAAYDNSRLPHSPDEGKIKRLLMECLEEYYGSLSEAVIDPDKAEKAISDVSEVLRRYGYE